MPRCLRCNAPVADGVEYCPPRRWIEIAPHTKKSGLVKFQGCASMCPPTVRIPQVAKWGRTKQPDVTPIKPYSMPHAGEIPFWILEDNPCYSNLRCYKYEAGSVFTNEHYGFGWSRFSQELRRVATELHIALVGFHVPTLAAAEVVEDVLLGGRSRSALSG